MVAVITNMQTDIWAGWVESHLFKRMASGLPLLGRDLKMSSSGCGEAERIPTPVKSACNLLGQ
jgi:hypothetical protein